MAAKWVTDDAKLAVLRRRKSVSEYCCTRCLPGPRMKNWVLILRCNILLLVVKLVAFTIITLTNTITG